MRPLVFLDCETTSLDERTRQAWEIAMIKVDEEGRREVTEFMVDVQDMTFADQISLRVGGYYERHPTGRTVTGKSSNPPPGFMLTETHAAAVVALVTTGAQIIGAQPDFDTITLTPLLRRFDMAPAWYHRKRDVESMTTGFLRREVGGLQDCATALGIESPPKDQHTALGDALLAERIYNRITAKTEPAGAGDIPFAELIDQQVLITGPAQRPVHGRLVEVTRQANFGGRNVLITLHLADGESYSMVQGQSLVTVVPAGDQP